MSLNLNEEINTSSIKKNNSLNKSKTDNLAKDIKISSFKNFHKSFEIKKESLQSKIYNTTSPIVAIYPEKYTKTDTNETPYLVNVKFCEDLPIDAKKQKNVIDFVFKIVEVIKAKGMNIEGIMRKNGDNEEIKNLIETMKKKKIDLEKIHIHSLCSLFKRFLSFLPEPIMKFDLYDVYLSTLKLKDVEEIKKKN
jgi:hypothetical protein